MRANNSWKFRFQTNHFKFFVKFHKDFEKNDYNINIDTIAKHEIKEHEVHEFIDDNHEIELNDQPLQQIQDNIDDLLKKESLFNFSDTEEEEHESIKDIKLNKVYYFIKVTSVMEPRNSIELLIKRIRDEQYLQPNKHLETDKTNVGRLILEKKIGNGAFGV